jgi:hypothetical protein
VILKEVSQANQRTLTSNPEVKKITLKQYKKVETVQLKDSAISSFS